MAKNDYKFIVAETAKNGFKCLKIHSNAYSQKGQQIAKQGAKMAKNGGKLPIIAKFQKLLNMVKK